MAGRYVVACTSGFTIPDADEREVEFVVQDCALGYEVVASFVAAAYVDSVGYRRRVMAARHRAQRLASELNAREGGLPYDRAVVYGPRFLRLAKGRGSVG
jgi:hypothetical protein